MLFWLKKAQLKTFYMHKAYMEFLYVCAHVLIVVNAIIIQTSCESVLLWCQVLNRSQKRQQAVKVLEIPV